MLDIRNSSGMRVVKILVIFWFSSSNNVGSATAQVHAAAESEEEPGQWKVQGEQEAAPNLPAKLGDQILLVHVTASHHEDVVVGPRSSLHAANTNFTQNQSKVLLLLRP